MQNLNVADALRSDLGEYAEEIERQPAIMRSLQLAKQKSLKEPSYLPKYRNLLEQTISRVKAQRSDQLDGDTLQGLVRDFLIWYDAEVAEKGLAAIERTRGGQPHQDWMAKWHPEQWKVFSNAFARVVETGTRSSVEALRPLAVTLMKAYVSAGWDTTKSSTG
jgi:hypothetical protein